MQKKLMRQMFFTGLIGIVFVSVAAFLLYYHVFSVQVRQDTIQLTTLYASIYEQNSDQFFSYIHLEDSVRLTLISEDGTVLLDSATDSQLENHAQRPEVVQALQSGSGSDERVSSTLSVRTFYEALLLYDGNILRVGVDTASLYSVFLSSLPWLLAVLLLFTILDYFVSKSLTKTLIQPVIAMGEHLEEVEQYVPYPELLPLANALAENRDIHREQEQFRREFTANISHELKTPLTSISGYAELMANGMVKGEDIPVFSQNIYREASRLFLLINDIIRISQLESASYSAELLSTFCPLDLSNIADEAISSLQVRARNSFLTLLDETASAPICGNHSLLVELCENLIDNAIRYNQPGGFVKVTTGIKKQRAFLSIEDNGIGIPKEAQSRVFERFYRVDKSRSKATGGTGLGLSIVKHIALLHHAEIQLESEPSKGTKTTIWFSAQP